MKSLWNNDEARKFADDPLQMRVYTSRLIGSEQSLVLHGGGNTSVKDIVTDLFGETVEVVFVKGSGWNLATIEAEGFAPVKLAALKKMAELEMLRDSEMVRAQRAAMTNPAAPNPSVEAILHAIIPFKYVDHTHADAVVAVSNTEDGEKRIREIYGESALIIPYIMPGFVLAKKVFEMTRSLDWSTIEGVVLLNHGIFTFHDDARTSYERMIELVNKAENYLERMGAFKNIARDPKTVPTSQLLQCAELRKEVSHAAGTAMVMQVYSGEEELGFANLLNVSAIATRGPLTPDHVIRTKHIPLITSGNIHEDVKTYTAEYTKYFERNTDGTLTRLDPAPRWAVLPGLGIASFGRNPKETGIIADIIRHTIRSIQWCEALGGWKALPEKDTFDIEYWELEQVKLRKGGRAPQFLGKVALVTGAGSGIGRVCAEALHKQGAVVAGLDINPEIANGFSNDGMIGIHCDVTDSRDILRAVERTIRKFGGLDVLISNAGMFPSSGSIEKQDTELWEKSLEINLSSHHKVLKACIPYLKQGIDPAVVIIGSKNVPAPGPGAGAYSVAKAGLTQLARVAALELGEFGIRVNVIHPNMVFDTALWSQEVLEERAKQYGVTVEEYKTSNLLRTEVSSRDVAALATTMAGPAFAKTTGAQVPVDGGNERVI